MDMFRTAVKLGITQDSLMQLIDDGAINARFIRGELMFSDSDIEEYVLYVRS